MADKTLIMLERQMLLGLRDRIVAWTSSSFLEVGALNGLVDKGFATRFPVGQGRMSGGTYWQLKEHLAHG